METSNQSKFKVGDVVSLKSLGGNMTVCVDFDSFKRYDVMWLDSSGRMQTARVPEDAIQHSSTFQFYPPAPSYPFLGYVPNNGKIASPVCVNSQSQADGCADPGDVH